MLNWDLLKHPMNWLIVFLMILIAAIAGKLVLQNLPTLKTS